jgi:hypothetical protein
MVKRGFSGGFYENMTFSRGAFVVNSWWMRGKSW